MPVSEVNGFLIKISVKLLSVDGDVSIGVAIFRDLSFSSMGSTSCNRSEMVVIPSSVCELERVDSDDPMAKRLAFGYYQMRLCGRRI